MLRPQIAAIVAMLVLTGCAATSTAAQHQQPPVRPTADSVATSVSASPAPPASSETSESPESPDSPQDVAGSRAPHVQVSAAGKSFDLVPYSFCFKGMCADGPVPTKVPVVDGAPEVVLSIPLPEWTFSATFESRERGGRQQTVDVAANPDGSGTLRPVGRAGDYFVTIFGRGLRQGDLLTAFRWRTAVDGPLAKPEATLAAAVATGKPSPQGETEWSFTLALTNMADTPRTARAHVTVTDSDGRSVVLTARRDPGKPGDSRPVGTVIWTAATADDETRAAQFARSERLGYRVVLVLDGRTYTASARYPDDEIAGNEPFVRLVFSPPLPSLR